MNEINVKSDELMLVKASGVVIENGDKKFLLQLRDQGAPSYKNQWLLFGGHAEGEETPLQTAIRELKEELDIIFKPERFTYLDKMIFVSERNHKSEYSIYKATIKPEEKIKLGEGGGYGFFSKEEALKLPIPAFMREIIEKYF